MPSSLRDLALAAANADYDSDALSARLKSLCENAGFCAVAALGATPLGKLTY